MTQDEEHGSASTLGQQSKVSEVSESRRGHTHQTPCAWADPYPTDQYAPPPRRCECKDRTGYLRRRHEYLHESPAGTRCVFCSTLRAWEPL